jgi:hypothetical protein
MVTRYLVKWKGYGVEEATWERASSLRHHAQDAIDEYEYRQAQERGETVVGVECVHTLKDNGEGSLTLHTVVVSAVDSGSTTTRAGRWMAVCEEQAAL